MNLFRVFESLQAARLEGFEVNDKQPTLVWRQGPLGGWEMAVIKPHAEPPPTTPKE